MARKGNAELHRTTSGVTNATEKENACRKRTDKRTTRGGSFAGASKAQYMGQSAIADAGLQSGMSNLACFSGARPPSRP